MSAMHADHDERNLLFSQIVPMNNRSLWSFRLTLQVAGKGVSLMVLSIVMEMFSQLLHVASGMFIDYSSSFWGYGSEI